MGPRLFERGDVFGNSRSLLDDHASMGPRLFERGDRMLPTRVERAIRDFNGAALV